MAGCVGFDAEDSKVTPHAWVAWGEDTLRGATVPDVARGQVDTNADQEDPAPDPCQALSRMWMARSQVGVAAVRALKCASGSRWATRSPRTLLRCLEIRERYVDPAVGVPVVPAPEEALEVTCESGVFVVYTSSGALMEPGALVRVEEFRADYSEVLRAMGDRGCISFSSRRLEELEKKFQLHCESKGKEEVERQREVGRPDWSQVYKVDTHIHHAACFTQKLFMAFIQRKMEEDMDTKVTECQTLRNVLKTVGVEDVDHVNSERLRCLASMVGSTHDTFSRWDVFKTKLQPFGNKDLQQIFLKTDNYMEGQFLGELTKEAMNAYLKNKSVCAEWRISIHGKSVDEWQKLARWFKKHEIQCPQIRWLIQVPRLYPRHWKNGNIRNFGDMLRNVFWPLFQASLDPSANTDMSYMLQQVVGMDLVDDESKDTSEDWRPPEQWNTGKNPPYTYWMFYMYANIRSLNALRRRRGLNTFAFRPHCGEAGPVPHLCSGFMLADSICHGVQLKETPVLQYLFYLAQIGLAVSPLSNDILFVPLQESPFGAFFRRGLNVSLSTDDPLVIHLTEDALIEEYIVAARTFRLSSCDLCEIARNSVLQSGFEQPLKEGWVGSTEVGGVSISNDEKKTNVPMIRIRFRLDCLRQESAKLRAAAGEVGGS